MKGAETPEETEPKPPASAGGSPVEAWVGRGSPQGWALAAAVLEGLPWCKPSWRSPLTLP